MNLRKLAVMGGLIIASIFGIALKSEAWAAQPEPQGVDCANFRRNSDGSWTPIRSVRIVGPRGPFTIAPDESFGLSSDSNIYGTRIAETLNRHCS